MVRSDGIEYTAGDEWLCLRAACPLAAIIGPRDLQLADVRAVDLGKPRIPDAVRPAPIAGPFRLTLRLLPRRCGLRRHAPMRKQQQHSEQNDRYSSVHSHQSFLSTLPPITA